MGKWLSVLNIWHLFLYFKALITSKFKVFPETLLHLLGYLSLQKNNEWVLTVNWVHTGSLTSEVRHESQHRMEEFYCHLSWQEISLPSASTPTDLVSGVEKSAGQRLCQLGFLLATIHCVCVQDEPLKSSSLIWSWVEEGCVCVSAAAVNMSVVTVKRLQHLKLPAKEGSLRSTGNVFSFDQTWKSSNSTWRPKGAEVTQLMPLKSSWTPEPNQGSAGSISCYYRIVWFRVQWVTAFLVKAKKFHQLDCVYTQDSVSACKSDTECYQHSHPESCACHHSDWAL